MSNIDMKSLGLSEVLEKEALLYDGMYIGRVLSQSKGIYRVASQRGELMAEVSGKLRYETIRLSDFPAAGDFVMLDRDEDRYGNAIIHHILKRKSAFIRKAAGTSNDDQIVAANIDIVFICMSLNNDFNLRRLERYLSIGWESGAVPVVVFTKADLCEDIHSRLSEAEPVCIGADIIVTSAMEQDGYAQVLPYIKKHQTIAFMGSSGVGKSTLINRLIGEDRLSTNGLRNDDKGRHTTTSRELILLPNGGMVIDTPGMRELGLESADLSKSFADIDELAQQCRFSDCTHTSEPGCAVKRAIGDGMLSEERLLSYQKLKKEAAYDGLNFRQIEAEKINHMFGGMGGAKNARRLGKEKNKRR